MVQARMVAATRRHKSLGGRGGHGDQRKPMQNPFADMGFVLRIRADSLVTRAKRGSLPKKKTLHQGVFKYYEVVSATKFPLKIRC